MRNKNTETKIRIIKTAWSIGRYSGARDIFSQNCDACVPLA